MCLATATKDLTASSGKRMYIDLIHSAIHDHMLDSCGVMIKFIWQADLLLLVVVFATGCDRKLTMDTPQEEEDIIIADLEKNCTWETQNIAEDLDANCSTKMRIIGVDSGVKGTLAIQIRIGEWCNRCKWKVLTRDDMSNRCKWKIHTSDGDLNNISKWKVHASDSDLSNKCKWTLHMRDDFYNNSTLKKKTKICYLYDKDTLKTKIRNVYLFDKCRWKTKTRFCCLYGKRKWKHPTLPIHSYVTSRLEMQTIVMELYARGTRNYTGNHDNCFSCMCEYSVEDRNVLRVWPCGYCFQCPSSLDTRLYVDVLVSVIIYVSILYATPNKRKLGSTKRHSCEDSVKVRNRERLSHVGCCCNVDECFCNNNLVAEEENVSNFSEFALFCCRTCNTAYNLICNKSSFCLDDKSNILFHLYDLHENVIPVQQFIVYPLVYAVTGYLNRVTGEGNLSQDEQMCYEVRRLQSFSSVQIRASPMRLSQSGFYATGSGDETRCYSCRETHRNWRMLDRPDQIHRAMSPNCPHLNRRDERNIPISSPVSGSENIGVFGVLEEYQVTTASDTVTSRPDSIAATAIVTETTATAATTPTEATSVPDLDISSAVYPQYRDLTSRLDSYRGWEWSHVQDPQLLASAGFYYAGYRDCVRCFYCGVGLRTWEREDDPWVEHVRWRSSCDYVRLTRGEQFAIQALANNAPAPLTLPVPSETTQTQTQVQTSRQVVTADGMDVVEKAEEMGFQRDQVESAMVELRGSQNAAGSNDPIQLETLLEKLIVITENMQTTPTVSQPLPPVLGSSGSLGPTDQLMSKTDLTEHENPEENLVTTLNMATSSARPDDSISASVTSQKAVEVRQAEGGTNESGISQKASEDTEVLSTNQERQLEEENQSLRDESTCKICLDNPSCIVFLPCGHLVTCAECAPALRKCPICRAFIRGTVRAHTVSRNN